MKIFFPVKFGEMLFVNFILPNSVKHFNRHKSQTRKMRHTLTFATTFAKEWQFGKQSSAYFISGFRMVFAIQDISGPTEHAINGFVITDVTWFCG